MYTFIVTQTVRGTLQLQVITLIKDDRRHKKTNYRVTISSEAVTQGSNGRHCVLLFIELVDEMSSLMMWCSQGRLTCLRTDAHRRSLAKNMYSSLNIEGLHKEEHGVLCAACHYYTHVGWCKLIGSIALSFSVCWLKEMGYLLDTAPAFTYRNTRIVNRSLCALLCVALVLCSLHYFGIPRNVLTVEGRWGHWISGIWLCCWSILASYSWFKTMSV